VCHDGAQVPALFRVRVSPSVPQELYAIHRRLPRQERLGPPKFFDASLPACHGLRTPADLPLLAQTEVRVLPSGALKPSASAIAISKLYQHFRVRGHPCGLQDTLSTLRPSCSPRVQPRLRHGRQTRYGWVASPYPTGTFTLQETPSFSWRENAAAQPRLEAGAQRTLEAVGCNTPCPTGSPHGRNRAALVYSITERSRVQTLPTAGESHPALHHGSRSHMGPTLVALPPMRRRCGCSDRACSPQEPPVRQRSTRPRARSAQGDAHPCAGMRPVHLSAAGMAMGAQEMMACVPDGDAPPLGRAFGP